MIARSGEICPDANCYRTLALLVLNCHLLYRPALPFFNELAAASGKTREEWFASFLWSMNFVTSKFALYFCSELAS